MTSDSEYSRANYPYTLLQNKISKDLPFILSLVTFRANLGYKLEEGWGNKTKQAIMKSGYYLNIAYIINP